MTITEYPKEKTLELLPLFENHKYLYALVEGYIKEGIANYFVDNVDNPKIALIGKQIHFITGDVNHSSVAELLAKIPTKSLFLVDTDQWVEKIKDYFGDKLKPYPRTKFSSDALTVNKMNDILSNIPEGYTVEKLSSKTIAKISDQAKFIIGFLYPSINDFIKRSFGFCVLYGDKIASLALAASPIYDNSFEIHIETDPEHQRKGLAMITCAALIKYSLENNLKPHWDADNEPSAKLALKLGFSKPEKYNGYIWFESQKK